MAAPTTVVGDPNPQTPRSSSVDTLQLDVRALKVLAHPLRARLLTALRVDGPGTATALADALGTNTGATSYHLRKLAEVGLVQETGSGRGKQRFWRAATEAHSWGPRTVGGDPDGRAASDWLQLHYFQQFTDLYAGWLAAQHNWPADWRQALGATDRMLTLSSLQMTQLATEVDELLNRYRNPAEGEPSAPAQSSTPTEQINVFVYAFPRSAEPS